MKLKALATGSFWHCEDKLIITSKKEIDRYVDASFYVFARDDFLSHWGDAKKGHSIIIMPCPNSDVAQMVEAACEKESDLSHVITRNYIYPLDKRNHYELFNAIRGPRFFGLIGTKGEKNKQLLRKYNVPF